MHIGGRGHFDVCGFSLHLWPIELASRLYEVKGHKQLARDTGWADRKSMLMTNLLGHESFAVLNLMKSFEKS